MKTKSNWGGKRRGAGPKRKTVRLSLAELAWGIYVANFGHLDDKYHQAEKLQEIEDWLITGTLPERPSIKSLAAEWREYDKEDPNLK